MNHLPRASLPFEMESELHGLLAAMEGSSANCRLDRPAALLMSGAMLYERGELLYRYDAIHLSQVRPHACSTLPCELETSVHHWLLHLGVMTSSFAARSPYCMIWQPLAQTLGRQQQEGVAVLLDGHTILVARFLGWLAGIRSMALASFYETVYADVTPALDPLQYGLMEATLDAFKCEGIINRIEVALFSVCSNCLFFLDLYLCPHLFLFVVLSM